MARYEYLSNPEILKYIDSLQRRVQWTRIIVLNWQDLPIKTIEGRATAGSVSINGKSAVRRTGSLTLVTEVDPKASNLDIMHEVTNINTLISINKRIQIEVGIKNNGGLYPDFDIFWMPLGTFLISNASVTYNNQGIQISLKLNDKMTLLNGEAGGTIPISLIHSPIENKEELDKDGNPIKEAAKFRDLITTFVRDYGEIPEYRIVIDDLPNQIENAVIWNPDSKSAQYLVKAIKDKCDKDGNQVLNEDGEPIKVISYTTTDTKPTEGIYYEPYDIVGYALTDFTFPKELASNAGESVTQVLDNIKNVLGNYEYFFDMDGIFHFQEIKNYLNEGSAIDELGAAINEKYFLNTARGKASYNFTDSALITSYGNNPQYNQIKNDYHVWGVVPDTVNAIQYHLIIQRLPSNYEKNYWRVLFYKDANGVTRAAKAWSYSSLEEAQAVEKDYYIVLAEDPSVDEDVLVIEQSALDKNENNEWSLIIEPEDLVFDFSTQALRNNWRLKMYFEAIEKNDTSSFGKEIIENLPLMMNVVTGEIKQNTKYYLDGINTNDSTLMVQVPIKGLGIEEIGRRTKVINDDDVNCLFAPKAEEVLFYAEGQAKPETSKTTVEVSPDIYNNLSINTTYYKSAYDVLRSSIHEHLSYNNNINITTMPIYHLDVNQRISVFNEESNIQGDYIIQSITIPLALNGMMTINAVKAIERI